MTLKFFKVNKNKYSKFMCIKLIDSPTIYKIAYKISITIIVIIYIVILN